MIEINLLPEELKKTKSLAAGQLPILKIMSVFFVILLCLQTFLYILNIIKRNELSTLERRSAYLEPQRKITMEIVSKTKDLETRINASEQLKVFPIDWAEMLGGLNEAIIPDVWLGSLKAVFKKEKNTVTGYGKRIPQEITISGYALGKSEIGTVLVAKLIDRLKASVGFSKYFKEIELAGMDHKTVDNKDTMYFVLICSVKEGLAEK